MAHRNFSVHRGEGQWVVTGDIDAAADAGPMLMIAYDGDGSAIASGIATATPAADGEQQRFEATLVLDTEAAERVAALGVEGEPERFVTVSAPEASRAPSSRIARWRTSWASRSRAPSRPPRSLTSRTSRMPAWHPSRPTRSMRQALR